ncbi:MAG: signal peptidase I [candidate division WOR-3 bacterium]
MASEERQRKIIKTTVSWVEVIVFVLILRALVIQAYVIPTSSMEDTMLIGDALLVNRYIFGVKEPFSGRLIIPGRMPKRNEIIVFKYPFENKDFIKRCVGLEGDTIEIIDKVLYVNGKRVEEPYVVHKDPVTYQKIKIDQKEFQKLWEDVRLADYYSPYIRDNFGPVIVPKDHIFAMGDNRDFSLDSRFWGPLHKRYLRGKPLFIYFSFEFPGGTGIVDVFKIWKWKSIRLDRIGKLV